MDYLIVKYLFIIKDIHIIVRLMFISVHQSWYETLKISNNFQDDLPQISILSINQHFTILAHVHVQYITAHSCGLECRLGVVVAKSYTRPIKSTRAHWPSPGRRLVDTCRPPPKVDFIWHFFKYKISVFSFENIALDFICILNDLRLFRHNHHYFYY